MRSRQERLSSVEKTCGSPPRVRSRLRWPRSASQCSRITSACAEQTVTSRRASCWNRDHLRVCGADTNFRKVFTVIWGSPPRVRSRPDIQTFRDSQAGITSACAEQTAAILGRSCLLGDHLRVCGADDQFQPGEWVGRGSPPRVRSRPFVEPVTLTFARITSACAEQTLWRRSTSSLTRDHLRVCGADIEE